MKRKFLVAALIAVVAALCGSGWAVAQLATATEVVGGQGGIPFSDQETAQGARILEIRVWSGDNVDSIQLIYGLSDGRTITGAQHGGAGGRLGVFRLDDDEYLVGLSGRAGAYIDSIQFQTNKRTSPLFGGRGGDRDFRIDVPANTQVTGLTGRAGKFLDAVGLTLIPIRRFGRGRGNFSLFGGPSQPGQTFVAGGSGGTIFVDSNIPPGAEIVEVRVRAGNFVDSVQMVYGSSSGRPVEGARHGGGGGRAMSFLLNQGEYIVGISGRYGDFVDSLRIHTNLRTSPLFGGNGGDEEFRVDIPGGNQATGFLGRSGSYVNSIGLTYGQIFVPERRNRDRRRNR